MGARRHSRRGLLLVEANTGVGASLAERLWDAGDAVVVAMSLAARWAAIECVRGIAHDTPAVICTAHTAGFRWGRGAGPGSAR